MTFIIGTPHTNGAGYHMYNGTSHGGKYEQFDVQTCPHCQKVIDMQVWAAASVQNFCNKCMKPTCDRFECVHECVPFLKALELRLDAIIKYQHYLRMAGLEPVPQPQPIFTG